MIGTIEAIGAAVWHASWQAAVLALGVAILVRCLGERIAPRWRYLLWGVVVVRLVVVATPVSPWSAFNLVGAGPKTESAAGLFVQQSGGPGTAVPPQTNDELPRPPAGAIEPNVESPTAAVSPVRPTAPPKNTTVASSPVSNVPAAESAPATTGPSTGQLVMRGLSLIWLAGCLASGLHLAGTALVLRRRLSACRPVADDAVLRLLEDAARRVGVRRTPALLVTPEAISPSIVGTWRPRIIVPESIVAETSTARLRHVLAHELAHLVRGDLWMNWLLLAARVLHWFNPVAWWATRAMQAEREAACDELALAALGEADRPAYAATIVDLASTLSFSALTPGIIGLFSSARRLQARVERVVRPPAVTTLRTPVVAGGLMAIALLGLTDAMPGATAEPGPGEKTANGVAGKGTADSAKKKDSPKPPRQAANDYILRGRCVDGVDSSALAGISIRLYKAQGQIAPPVLVAQTISDARGNFEFKGLEAPRPENRLDRLTYGVIAVAPNRPIGMGFHFPPVRPDCVIHMGREKATLSGRVVNEQGQPVAGATVMYYSLDGRAIPGVLSATTDEEGDFEIPQMPLFRGPDGAPQGTSFTVRHPDYPETTGRTKVLPADVTVTLPTGGVVAGWINDGVTGKAAVGTPVIFQRIDIVTGMETLAATDGRGRFRITLPEGRYNILVEVPDRVCVALTDREFLVGQKIELPPMTLVSGGVISGRVINTKTGEPVAVSDHGDPIAIGLYGPSHPPRNVISPARLAIVDESGRFALRAAPGENFPYFVNTRGDRMAWDTLKQTPIVVNEGETTSYDMLITPPVPPAEKLQAARELVAALPRDPSERTQRIILEFRKLNHTVDETELWCTLMRELVTIGRDAAPGLCQELDATTENKMLRRLGFALRAIGDARAVPALIRAIPKTLLASSSDFGLIVADAGLMTFMQKYDLDEGEGGPHFDFGRPEREIAGALHKLTRQNLNDSELFGIGLNEDPRRQVLQRRLFNRQAQRWQAWWEAHWRELTDDADYARVNLTVVDEPLPPATKIGPKSRLGEGIAGAILSPAVEMNGYAWQFYDLDTGYRPKWPAGIPRDESQIDQKQLAGWAAENGIDLMCITQRSPDGKTTYVLRAFGMKAWEIGPRDVRNLDRLLAEGKLPEGKQTGELLMHYDEASQNFIPNANGSFLFVTREGNYGLIETTDRILRTANLSGPSGSEPAGVGFFLGVKFNLKAIVPP